MIVFGLRKFGWVDQVEGLGTVATTFFHIMFVPLIPTGSHLMVDDDRGISVPLSMKSVLVAWFRSFLFWGALLSWVAALPSTGLACCSAVPLTVGYFALPLLVRKASPARAAELREQILGGRG
jgi:hypothetical protein